MLLADLDNNAALDIIVSAADTQVLLGGAPSGFTALPSPIALRTYAVSDLDGKGRLDLVGLAADGRLAVAKNAGTKAYHWQRLRPRAATATGDQRINSFGIGGEVEVRSGLHVQTYPIASPVVHIGLGEATSSDVIRIFWPNGVMQSEFTQKADATIRADQRLKGSCPWLFAWNGREMAFVTDLIWRSPLGLRINAQVTADASMTEDWVKVGGSQLVPRDGAYDLRITAELWETHFFDLVSLAVVDHPVGTEVFVDERFAIPRRRSRRWSPVRCSRSRVSPTTPDATHPPWSRHATTSTSTSPAVAPTRGSRASTPSNSSCLTRRRARVRSTWSRRAGSTRPTARSTWRSRRARRRSRSASPLEVAGADGRFRVVKSEPRLPVGQGQDAS